MYYKFTLEKLDYDRNVILTSQVMLTEEMVKNTDSQSMDILKYTAGKLVDEFRYKEKQNEKTN